ncbi:MAG: indolepyruvate ferredoxin oxidoreductase subunit alpha [Spirochaetia bacterium]|nr:indolepyruvate ferredoxin oxidoreductase subunit alpha [Spirochaetia bacterium]
MKELMSGNEAIARGIWEAGVQFASGYPGTPSTEILENVSGKYPEVTSEWAPNEKTAVEAAIGASVGGARSIATMKHVGVNVAADPIFTVAYTGVTGGLAIVSADDPSCHSSQNEQDNRYYATAANLAMLEPSNSQEAKDFVRQAMEISETYNVPVMIRMTTRVCHSKSLVETDERKEVPYVPYVKQRRYNPVPAVSYGLHADVMERFKKLEELSNDCPLNTVEWNTGDVGIVTSGVSYQYAKEVFGDAASYLKIGLTNPLPMAKIKDFSSKVKTLYVIEELEPYMENQMKAAGLSCIGKEKVPRLYELNPDILRSALLGVEPKPISHEDFGTVERPPVLCAGCPHRGIYVEMLKLKNIVFSSDIGCYALGRAKDFAFCMGSGFSAAHGMAKMFKKSGSDKRVVGIMGDSTFFHSGMTSMLECVYNNSNVLLVVMDNRITAMTGHQENPGTGYNIMGEEAPLTDIAKVAEALGVKHIKTINPLHLGDCRKALQWGLGFDEPALIITKYPCALKKFSEIDKQEFGSSVKKNYVDTETCIGCRTCVRTGCPALVYDKATKKVSIDLSQCTGCDICMQVCPTHAIRKVEG